MGVGALLFRAAADPGYATGHGKAVVPRGLAWDQDTVVVERFSNV